MAKAETKPGSERRAGALAALLVQLLLAFGLVAGLGVDRIAHQPEALTVFEVVTPPKPPPPKPALRRRPTPAPTAAAPTPRPAAPPPPIPDQPLPQPAAPAMPAPADGSGPGDMTGEGASGGGSGGGSSGGSGSGDGDTPPRRVAGQIDERDYPKAAFRAGAEGALTTRSVIGADGRVESCDIVESSGNADLDATTCRLIVERYRYEPSRDADGRPVRAIVIREHRWGIAR
jgi:protein TonB